MYSIPLISYCLIRDSCFETNFKPLKSLRLSIAFFLALGLIYSTVTVYFFYIPKERYWRNLINNKNKYISHDPDDYLTMEKPFKKINLKRGLEEESIEKIKINKKIN